MLNSELKVSGPFADQHRLVKAGSLIAFLEFLILLNFVPIALALWVLLLRNSLPPEDRSPLLAYLPVLAIMAMMFVIGLMCIPPFFRWIAGPHAHSRRTWITFSLLTLFSFSVVLFSVLLGIWTPVFICGALALIPLSITSHLLIMVGQRTAYETP